jgi:ATP-binding cassette subfamily B protein
VAAVARSAPLAIVGWLLTAVALAGLTAAGLVALHGAVDAVARSGRRAALPWLGAMAGVTLVSELLAAVRPLLQLRIRQRSGLALRRAALARLYAADVEVLDSEEVFDRLRRVDSIGDSVGNDLVGTLLTVLQQVPTALAYVVALGAIAPWVPVALVGGQLLAIASYRRLAARSRAVAVETTPSRRLGDYYASILSSRAHAAEVRLWGIADEIVRRWRALQEAVTRETLRLSWLQARTGMLVGSVVGVVVMAGPVSVALAGRRVDPGVAALVMSALTGLLTTVSVLTDSTTQLLTHAGSAADVRYVSALPATEVPRPAHLAARFPVPLRDGVRLHGVSYSYPGAAQPALVDVSFAVPAGALVAVVGPNGAGKTTLASLLLGLRQPTAGRVEVDGVDLRSIPRDDIRRHVGGVFQKPIRYPASLAANVALRAEGLAVADGEAAWTGPLGQLRPLLTSDSVLSPEFGGPDLSGGEWQRVALARALFREGFQVLVLDEPTSSLDPLAEVAFCEELRRLARGRTVFWITHRIGPARLADLVLVLEEGRCVEQGPPEALLLAGGAFRCMFDAQAVWYR